MKTIVPPTQLQLSYTIQGNGTIRGTANASVIGPAVNSGLQIDTVDSVAVGGCNTLLLYRNPGAAAQGSALYCQNGPNATNALASSVAQFIQAGAAPWALLLAISGAGAGNAIYIGKQTADPGGQANAGSVYTKVTGGVTQLFYQASDGTVTQVTPGAATPTLASVLAAGNTSGGTSISMTSGDNIILGTAGAGTQIGTATTQILGFFGATGAANTLALAVATNVKWSTDANISRTAAGIIAAGTGAQGSTAGTFQGTNIIAGTGAAATNTTAGFAYTQGGAGVPTGVPANLPTGSPPLYVDTTDNRAYAYYGGAWNNISAASGAPTWASVLASGNTSGANSPIISSSQNISWATGGAFSASAAELLGPTDQGMFMSARPPAGSAAGNPVQVTGSNATTAGAGGAASLVGGNGVGTNQAVGTAVINSGGSTGNANGDVILFKAPPLVTGSGSGANAAATVAKFAASNSAAGSAYNFVANATGSAIATTATDGFVHIGSSAGAPAGTPTLYTGAQPITIDSTNNFLYFYSGGAWQKITSATATWTQVLAAGNTSGANSAIMSSSQNISWATGGTFNAASAELLGPTDAGFFISARSPAGAGNGQAVTITAANGTTTGGGGGLNATGGNGVGANQQMGPVTLAAGQSTGNAAGAAILFKGPASATGSGSGANAVNIFAQFSNTNAVAQGAYSFVANASGSNLSTVAVDGFVYLGSSSGAPAGTPTAFTGANAITIDSANSHLYFYSGGAWHQADGGGATPTWSAVLTAGNTSGATSAIMSSSQNISWATGGTFSASAAELLGPTDQGMFISARAPAGSANGNAVTITASNATTSGAGAAVNLQAGGGAGDPGSPNSKGGNINITGGTASGTNNAGGTVTCDSGPSTGNRQYYAFVVNGSPIGVSGTGSNATANRISMDGTGAIYIGAQPTNLTSGIGNSITFQFNAAATGPAAFPGAIAWSTGWGSSLIHMRGPTDQDLQIQSGGATRSIFLEGGATGAAGIKVAVSSGSSSGSILYSNKISSYGGGTGLTLTGTGAGIIFSQDVVTQYNGIATAAQGLSPIYASARFTGQNGAKTVCTYTPTADGTFVVSANVNVTVATNFNFTVNVNYTDETNTAQTLILPFIQPTPLLGAITVLGFIASTNTTPGGPYCGLPSRIRVKANTAITVATVSGGGAGFTTVTYNVDADIAQRI